MKKFNYKKLIARILELIVIIATIIITIKSIQYATAVRGYKAYGSEYCMPIFGISILYIIETILDRREK